jgi:hypothetical protein
MCHSSLLPVGPLAVSASGAACSLTPWGWPPTAGLHELRSWFAQAAGSGVDAQDGLIISRGQSALSATVRALTPSGTPFLVESPTFPGALAAARAAGVRPIPVPTDRDGFIPEHLAAPRCSPVLAPRPFSASPRTTTPPARTWPGTGARRSWALPRPQAHSSSKTTSCADCHTSKDLPRAFSKTMTTAAWSTSPRRPRRPHQLARGSSDRPRPGRAACARAAGSGRYVRLPSPPRSHARPGDRARSASPSGA